MQMTNFLSNVKAQAINNAHKVKKYLGSDSEFYLIRQNLIEDNIWMFSQMKSGTTLLLNAMSFYNALEMGIEAPSFGDTAHYGFARSMHDSLKELPGIIQYSRSTGNRWVIQSHTYIEAAPFHLILQSRNAMDYCVSSYFFHFKMRKGRENFTIDNALKNIVEKYITTHQNQLRARDEAKSASFLSYETLIADPVAAMEPLLTTLRGSVDVPRLRKAVELAGSDRLKAYESSVGHAIVAGKGNFSGSHFIRSGKVGEGEQFFEPRQLDYIREHLASAGIPESGVIE